MAQPNPLLPPEGITHNRRQPSRQPQQERLHLPLPGSRSIANRALVAAALAQGESVLTGITPCDDTLAMHEGLTKLGVNIRRQNQSETSETKHENWRVTGLEGRLRSASGELDVRASGTTARFLSAAAALADGPVTLDGSPRMRQRPIAELAHALRELGARAEILGEAGCPPLRVTGGAGGLRGGDAEVDASRSSQFVSALLLAAPCAKREVVLRLHDGALVSRPFVDLTLQVMRAFGAEPEWRGNSELLVPPTGYQSADFAVEPDAQAAVYAFAVAAIRSRAIVLKLPGNSLQADLGVLNAFEEMGCRVVRERHQIRLRGPRGRRLRGIEVDGNDWPDAVLALAVVALFAKGPTTIHGIAHLRQKESDRLAALETELRRLGADTRVGEGHLYIKPKRNLQGALLNTYEDHRMAMSLTLAGLRIPGVSIHNPDCVAKTWPGFFEDLHKAGLLRRGSYSPPRRLGLGRRLRRFLDLLGLWPKDSPGDPVDTARQFNVS